MFRKLESELRKFERIAIQVSYKHFRGCGGSEGMLILLINGGGGSRIQQHLFL